ncbi:hypothetical protein Hsw_PA0005 (plasmid) [Hymenobacter swuensis DY53]|uniref:Uncharacterized protein n=1 Tax=Hymenobacter swuensis DY53 TaxID=1227739 RepID=W8ERX2_9BACT|nr:hypothetical protein Hsw_PA0005 [Hymenobacter swuensis DY53]
MSLALLPVLHRCPMMHSPPEKDRPLVSASLVEARNQQ